MKNGPEDNQLPAVLLGGVVANETEERTEEPESERLSQLPEHENDRARGTDDSIGAGVASVGGTAGESDDPSKGLHTGPDETS